MTGSGLKNAAGCFRGSMWIMVSAALGCGGTGDIAGKVTYGGVTVRSGTVLAAGQDGLPHYGKIEADGTYVIRRVPVGQVRLAVHSPDPSQKPPKKTMEMKPGEAAGQQPPKETAGPITPEDSKKKGWFPLPQDYANFYGSGLICTVSRGRNGFDIELKRLPENSPSGKK